MYTKQITISKDQLEEILANNLDKLLADSKSIGQAEKNIVKYIGLVLGEKLLEDLFPQQKA